MVNRQEARAKNSAHQHACLYILIDIYSIVVIYLYNIDGYKMSIAFRVLQHKYQYFKIFVTVVKWWGKMRENRRESNRTPRPTRTAHIYANMEEQQKRALLHTSSGV